ncbi:MAG TPA: ring-cleaving dioxygenase [Chloroflexia bacterium]|nr:ring-cleaving dioxygenase [Chloroflexia bacterium]
MKLSGLHHVSAVTGDAAGNVRFYTQVLGLRLVKKTVNQDDVSMYHLFYGDEAGSAGTEVTFFDWPHAGKNVPGVGSIAAISLRVPGREVLGWWEERFNRLEVPHEGVVERGGRATIAFTDPEGQRLILADDGGAPGGTPWIDSPVPPKYAITGLHAVTILVRRLEPSALLLTEVLGFKQVGEYPAPEDPTRTVTVFAAGDGGPGTEVHVEVRPELRLINLGVGGVHHVAFRTPNDEEHKRWQQRLTEMGLHVTPVIDRYYFRSIYFREPGGVLYEIATDGPGFATDESVEHLGERLALPPFLEPHRAEIEANLHPIG